MNNEQKTILIVDDQEKNREILEIILESMNYQTLSASNGLKAISIAKEKGPDLILMDVVMPIMDGFEATARLKEDSSTKLIPVVIITSLNDVGDRIKALDAGADDFLTKPVERTELTARVKSLLKVKAYNDHLENYRGILEEEVAIKTKELQLTNIKLKKSNLETIHRLTRAAEYKDQDTAAHIHRMSHYSEAIARKMNLKSEDIENIVSAAPMHDIGKIGTPDHILLKPGKLNPEEWTIMKQHTQIGADILDHSDSALLKMGHIIAKTHHEMWDGCGYPDGLKHEEIPLIGRIVALADVFDALTSKRPYKDAYSIEKSLSIIKTSRGKHFDPKIVDIFLSIINEIIDIKNYFQD